MATKRRMSITLRMQAMSNRMRLKLALWLLSGISTNLWISRSANGVEWCAGRWMGEWFVRVPLDERIFTTDTASSKKR